MTFDIRTLMILEDYLDSFQGIVITVSHDRYFLIVVGRILRLKETENSSSTKADSRIIRQRRRSGRRSLRRARRRIRHLRRSLRIRERTAAEGDPEGNAPRTNVKPREKKLKFSYKEQWEWIRSRTISRSWKRRLRTWKRRSRRPQRTLRSSMS